MRAEELAAAARAVESAAPEAVESRAVREAEESQAAQEAAGDPPRANPMRATHARRLRPEAPR